MLAVDRQVAATSLILLSAVVDETVGKIAARSWFLCRASTAWRLAASRTAALLSCPSMRNGSSRSAANRTPAAFSHCHSISLTGRQPHRTHPVKATGQVSFERCARLAYAKRYVRFRSSSGRRLVEDVGALGRE